MWVCWVLAQVQVLQLEEEAPLVQVCMSVQPKEEEQAYMLA